MAERTTVTQINQIGIEGAGTPGTAVAATKRMTALSIGPAISTDINFFVPAGQKFASVAAVNREWVEASLEGQPTYSELVYPLSSLLTTPTVAEILDGATPTGGFRWNFNPSSTAEDTPKTFTVEQGSSFRAQRFAYGIVTELGMEIGRDALSLDGSMLGTRLEDGITLTPGAGVTTVPLVPILPSQIDVFLDATPGGIGTTKLARVLSAGINISERYGPLWVLDSSKTSWAAHVELVPTATVTMTVEADAQGMALLTNMRGGDTRFIRIRGIGSRIYTGATNVDHSFQFDCSAKVSEPGDYADADGVYAIEFTFQIVHDTTAGWNKALSVELINEVAAL